MAEKKLGYVELEWTCPSCNTRNPGSARKCQQCGTPMPEETQFEQTAEEKLITEANQVAAAQAAPDIYCGYCGTRNAAASKNCKQCGASLTEGKARAAGGVLGGLRDKPAPPQICPSCGTANAVTARKCFQCGAPLGKAVPAATPAPQPAQPMGKGCIGIIALAGVALLAVIIFFVVQSGRRSETVGQVVDFGWQRTVMVEGLQPVTREAWIDDIPVGAEVGQCRQEVYQVVDEPVAGSREICGTPYVVDRGTGYGEVRQDCQYEVLRDRCQYQSLAWVALPSLQLQGSDTQPRWPAAQLGQNQRVSGQNEEYRIVFRANDRDYTYTTRDEQEFLELTRADTWVLEVNGLGQITAIRAS